MVGHYLLAGRQRRRHRLGGEQRQPVPRDRGVRRAPLDRDRKEGYDFAPAFFCHVAKRMSLTKSLQTKGLLEQSSPCIFS